MNMSWDAIGAIAEVFGAIAVVGTIIFLAIQIRQSDKTQRDTNALARASAVDQVYEQLQGFRLLVASDAEVARIWQEGRQGQTLSSVDAVRFGHLASSYLQVFPNWSQRSIAIGNMEYSERAAQALANNLKNYPGLHKHWYDSLQNLAPNGFRSAMEKHYEELNRD